MGGSGGISTRNCRPSLSLLPLRLKVWLVVFLFGSPASVATCKRTGSRSPNLAALIIRRAMCSRTPSGALSVNTGQVRVEWVAGGRRRAGTPLDRGGRSARQSPDVQGFGGRVLETMIGDGVNGPYSSTGMLGVLRAKSPFQRESGLRSRALEASTTRSGSRRRSKAGARCPRCFKRSFASWLSASK